MKFLLLMVPLLSLAAFAETIAEVKLHHGVPTLFINSEPRKGMGFGAYSPSNEVFKEFNDVGVELFSICATPTDSGYNLSPMAWQEDGSYDFSILDQRVAMILHANPKAGIYPRLNLHAPPWWCDAHPDDVVIAEGPDGQRGPLLHSGGRKAPSWASEIWRQDTIRSLQKLLEHVQASPYADNIIGYQLGSGSTEEWISWEDHQQRWGDYSPANLRKFRDWLRMTYKTDDTLRRAWKDETVTLATAALPRHAQRANAMAGSFRDPQKEQQVIDFYIYTSWLTVDTLSEIAHALKDFCGRKKLVGAYYGYLLQLCGEERQQNGGHNALTAMLNCPDIDFLCSPTSYFFRQVGGAGTSHFMAPIDSIKLHGKLWFNENDIRTSLTPCPVGAWGKPENVEGDLLQQRKELASVLVHGTFQYWFDVATI